ncbi:MAG TPA: DICT sensory domain-containing protein [Burkholderiaceae bacterium]|nr:DICT sensory domain-containing protein [Burkholderiaceae bacterium]
MAARSGVPAGTLRMWEERYGFPKPNRLPSGHRRFTEDQVEQVRAVVAARESGLSLPVAIERVAGAPRERSESLYGLLRVRRPELAPELIPKPRMIALSHAIEDECFSRAHAPVLIGSFQRGRFFRSEEKRWRDFAATAAVAVAFADFDTRTDTRPVQLHVERDHQLNREWAIVCFAPGASAALAGWEPPGQDEFPDAERRFEAIWTVDPELVYEAVEAAAALAEREAPSVADEIRRAAGPRPAPSGPDVRGVAALARRMVSYVSE